MAYGWDYAGLDWVNQGASLNRDDYLKDDTFLDYESQFTNAFGENFGQFSYDAYLNDEAYRNRIIQSIEDSGSGPKTMNQAVDKSRALKQLLDYHKNPENKAGMAADDALTITPQEIEGVFGPLRQELSRLIEQQVQYGRGEISRGTARIEDKVRESLAGSGMGRSGVAAQAYGDVASVRQGKIEDFTNQARAAGAQAEFGLQQDQADKEYQQLLIQQGWSREDALSATAFKRQLRLLHETSMIQAAMDEPSVFEEFGPIFQAIGMIAGSV